MANTFISMMQCALWFTGEVDLHAIWGIKAIQIRGLSLFMKGGGIQIYVLLWMFNVSLF